MKISGNTFVFGIIGNPIEHSLSPILHNYFFEKMGYNAVYIPLKLNLEIQNRNCFKKILQSLNLKGLSITIPHKKLGFLIADQKDFLTEFTQSCNTLLMKEKFYGYNTDGPGAIQAILSNTPLENKNILILGYGGSASAIAGEILLNHKPKSLFISGRNKKKAEQLIRLLNKNFKNNIKAKFLSLEDKNFDPNEIDILINTTPIGMKGFQTDTNLPIEEKYILKKHIVFDIIYNPIETPLLKIAKQKKATIIEGYWMFLYQAIKQMEIFTNIKPEENLIKKFKKILLGNLK